MKILPYLAVVLLLILTARDQDDSEKSYDERSY
jgi:hypothetical protein